MARLGVIDGSGSGPLGGDADDAVVLFLTPDLVGCCAGDQEAAVVAAGFEHNFVLDLHDSPREAVSHVGLWNWGQNLPRSIRATATLRPYQRLR